MIFIVLCSPKCRVKVTGKKKNFVINGILEAYLKAYPQKRPEPKVTENDLDKRKNNRHEVRWKENRFH